MHLQKINKDSWNVWDPNDEVVKKHLRSEGLEDDMLVEQNLIAAEISVEDELNYPIINCQLTGYQCDFSVISFVQIPTYRGGVVVKYYNESDVLTTLDAANFVVLANGIYVKITFKGTLPALADREDAVQITFDAGYEKANDVDRLIKQAILKRAGSFYANHEDEAARYMNASSNLLAPKRHRIA